MRVSNKLVTSDMNTTSNDGDVNIAKKCCICGKVYKGYGNFAEPVKRGYCCDNCNANYVIPARMKFVKELREDVL